MNFSKLFHIRHLFFLFLLLPINGKPQQIFDKTNCFAIPNVSVVSSISPLPLVNYKSISPIGSGKLVVSGVSNLWIFDGENWDSIPVSGNPILASISNQKVYIADEKILFSLTSIGNGLIKKEILMTDIQTLGERKKNLHVNHSGDVYYSTQNQLWKLDKSPIQIDSSSTSITLFSCKNNLFYLDLSRGIFKIDKGDKKPKLIFSKNNLSGKPLIDIFEIGDTTVLVYSSFPWLTQLEGRGETSYGNISRNIKSAKTIIKKAFFAYNEIFLLTDREGILVLNLKGDLKFRYSNTDYPFIDHIEDIQISSPESFLAVTSSAIYRFLSYKVQGRYNSFNNFSSGVNHFLLSGNNIYCSSNQGVSIAGYTSGEYSRLCFTNINNIQEEVLWLHESSDCVFAFGKESIYKINDTGVLKVSDTRFTENSSRIFTVDISNETLVIALFEEYLRIKAINDPQKKLHTVSFPSTDVDFSSCFINQSVLYIKTHSNKWFSYIPDLQNSSWEIVTQLPDPTLADKGFNSKGSTNVYSVKANPSLVSSNSDDYIIPLPNTDSLIIINSYPKEQSEFHSLWLGSYKRSEYKLIKGLGLLSTTEKVRQVFWGPDSTVWISTESGLKYYSVFESVELVSAPTISIFSTSFSSGNEKIFLQKGYFSDGDSSSLAQYRSPLHQLAINLSSFGSSALGSNHESILYSTFIEGYDKNWTSWSQNNVRELPLLKHGTYTIWAKSMNLMGKESDLVRFSFTVRPRFYETWFTLVAIIILVIIGFYTIYRWRSYSHAKVRFKLESLINQRTEELVKEKEKTENLLARVLPHDTASELKEKGKVNTQRFKMVTVLFSDIEGFTRITDETNPETLIDQLDKFFLYFDSVVEKYKIEKIKTIGDAYMCAGGIPEKNRTNPVEVILAALEMMLYMKSITSGSARSKVWELRIGIDTGPVIAGVVGRSKLTYDIWGSTVNTASRMESSGEVGQINISGNTFMLVKDYFICTFRGKMPVKNKGDIQMYFVNGIKPSLSENMQGLKPNTDFFILLQLIRLGDLEDFILEKLEKGLPKNLYYHNLKHTVDVYTQVELIGRSENVTKEEMLLLRTAALFHDAGHLIDYDTHEEMAVKLIREILPEYQYTENQIETISQLIMATKMPPTPKNLLEEIMCDADLDYLGRPDFLPVSNMLYKELHEHGKIGTMTEWNELQIRFIDKHFYFTKTARRLRNVNKQSQLDKLKLWMENN